MHFNFQLNRVKLKSIINLGFNKKNILKLIKYFSKNNKKFEKTTFFGEGHSAIKFINIIKKKNFWNIKNQKQFNEISIK